MSSPEYQTLSHPETQEVSAVALALLLRPLQPQLRHLLIQSRPAPAFLPMHQMYHKP